jgi:hypothetical protein
LFYLQNRTVGYKGEQCSGGEGGIRTHGTVSPPGAFNYRTPALVATRIAVTKSN